VVGYILVIRFNSNRRRNFFFTLTNLSGDVLFVVSFGSVKSVGKLLLRRSTMWDRVYMLLRVVSYKCKRLGVYEIDKVYFIVDSTYIFRNFDKILLKSGIRFNNISYVLRRPHNTGLRRKKVRRL